MIGKVRLAQNNCIEALQICADAVQSGDADAIKAAAKNLKRVQEILLTHLVESTPEPIPRHSFLVR